jgi:multimeric flavodoxin WrbA
MNVMVVSSSPNKDGLTAAAAQAAAEGIRAAGHSVEEVRLNDLKVMLCQACNNGWGSCREEGQCGRDDDFPALHTRFKAADGYVLVTPVYFGEPSESMKAFLDRMRRCERAMGEKPGGLSGKPVLAVACAGGGGNGTVNCLDSFDRWIQHVGARKWDFIGITRFIRGYKLQQITQAAAAMVTGARIN